VTPRLAIGPNAELAHKLQNLQQKTIASLQEMLEASKLSRHEIQRRVMQLLAIGAIKVTREGLTFEESTIEVHPEKLDLLSEGEPQIRRETTEKPSELVATVPIRMLPKLTGYDIALTEDTFRSMILSCERELLVVSPFVEREGVYALRAEFAEAFRRGVRMKILTRDSESPSTTLALYDLFQIFGQRLESREFHVRAKVYGEFYRQIESTHAKLLIIDRREAYLGSAEIRPNALHTNFEMGIRSSNVAIVHGACHLFDTFWNDAAFTKEIDLNSIGERVATLVQRG
jgi:phosphatidylserine/phosphatidylglycerophosphate/cardiolipin synthase-like enzyme